MLTVALWLFSAAFAFATPPYPGYGTVVAPPGNTTFEPVRIVKGGLHGTFSRVIDVKSTYSVEFQDGCIHVLETKWELTFTATYEWGVKTDSGEAWSEGATTIVTEFCL